MCSCRSPTFSTVLGLRYRQGQRAHDIRDLRNRSAISASCGISSRGIACEILLPGAGAHWLTGPDRAVRIWFGTLGVFSGVVLALRGGHFPGSAVVRRPDGALGAGALLAGDAIVVTPGGDRVTFVWSVRTRLPLPERQSGLWWWLSSDIGSAGSMAAGGAGASPGRYAGARDVGPALYRLPAWRDTGQVAGPGEEERLGRP